MPTSYLGSHQENSITEKAAHHNWQSAVQEFINSSIIENEEWFRAIFQQIATGIAITTLEGQLQQCNPAFCNLLGYTLEEIRQLKFGSLIHPDDVEANMVEVNRLLSGEIKQFEIENRYIHKEGKSVWVRKYISFLPDKFGRPSHYIALVSDITERKRLEMELRASIETHDEFISIAAHELKTPLTALNLQLDLLKRVSSSELEPENKISVLAESAYESTRMVSALVDELLDITKIRVGKLELDKKEMDLRSVLFENVAFIRETAAISGSCITLQADEPVNGIWDPKRINQILSNLLSNAIKYGDGEAIDVRLFINPKSDMVTIEVQDQGLGIPKNMQAMIFKRFQRVSNKTITGLGLGLYIVRQVVEAHGGSIQVKSEVGKGSVFTVLLPRWKMDA